MAGFAIVTRVRPRAAGWRALVATLLAGIVVLGTARAHAAEPDLSGRYRGEQEGVPFAMALQQEGQLLHGVIVMRATDVTLDSAGDRVTGAVAGGSLVLIRHGDPVEIWMGETDGATMRGRWVSPSASGDWFAQPWAPDTVLRITKSVRPSVIPVDERSEVQYVIQIVNGGDTAAQAVQVRDSALPPFFAIERVELQRLDGTAVAVTDDRINDDDGLFIGDLAPGAGVMVTVSGVASPERTGTFVNVATAKAANADRVAARAALDVVGPLRVANAFLPPRVPEGFDGRATYFIRVDGRLLREADLLVTDRGILDLFRGATVSVRGAEAQGSLDTGLVISAPRGHAAPASVVITVVGSVAQLAAGEYASTVVVESPATGQSATATATLHVQTRDARPPAAVEPRDPRGVQPDDREAAETRPTDGAEDGIAD